MKANNKMLDLQGLLDIFRLTNQLTNEEKQDLKREAIGPSPQLRGRT